MNSGKCVKSEDNWRMNPCEKGHLDVGAASGIAQCNTCGEKIECYTTKKAIKVWNDSHPIPVGA